MVMRRAPEISRRKWLRSPDGTVGETGSRQGFKPGDRHRPEVELRLVEQLQHRFASGDRGGGRVARGTGTDRFRCDHGAKLRRIERLRQGADHGQTQETAIVRADFTTASASPLEMMIRPPKSTSRSERRKASPSSPALSVEDDDVGLGVRVDDSPQARRAVVRERRRVIADRGDGRLRDRKEDRVVVDHEEAQCRRFCRDENRIFG